MGGHYEKGIYDQLMDVMDYLEKLEARHKEDIYWIESRHDKKLGELNDKIAGLNGKVETLEKENAGLKKENELLKDDNARLRSIINNDSSNSSLPPSIDQAGGTKSRDRKKPMSTTAGKRQDASPGARKGTKGQPL